MLYFILNIHQENLIISIQYVKLLFYILLKYHFYFLIHQLSFSMLLVYIISLLILIDYLLPHSIFLFKYLYLILFYNVNCINQLFYVYDNVFKSKLLFITNFYHYIFKLIEINKHLLLMTIKRLFIFFIYFHVKSQQVHWQDF